MQLNVPRTLEQVTYDGLSHKFATNADVSIFLPQDLSAGEIRELALFLLRQDFADLRNLLLADIVEYANFPSDLLEKVFHKGDIGCRVAVSLRDDLPMQLEELCANSTDKDVREHYASRKAYRTKP